MVRQVGNSRGIRFDCEIDVGQWVKRIGHPGQQRIDRAVQAVRAGSVPSALDNEPPRRSFRDLAKDLREICDQMASRDDLSIEIGEALVRIETIAVELARLAEDR